MRLWIGVLLLLLIACAAAYGWHALSLDPGYVQLRFAGWNIETSFVFGLILLLLLGGLASFLWRVLRWPTGWWKRRARRRGRERLAVGLVALVEGRHAQAMRELDRAAHITQLRAPALLARAQAAHASGDTHAADAALEEASAIAGPAALAMRARFLLQDGQPAEALTLLKPQIEQSTLAPNAWLTLSDAALLCGDTTSALQTLAPLARGAMLSATVFAAREAQTLSAALMAASSSETLNRLWSGFTRAQRRVVPVVIAYAERAAALGQPLSGMSEIEAGLRREWSEALVRSYGNLGPGEASARLRQAEGWLAGQPNSAGLLLTLGRLCNLGGLWGKAHDYLCRLIAIEPTPAAWEALGDACAGQEDLAAAQRAYRNALRSGRREPTESVPDALRGPLDTRASIVEERSEHGVPRIAGALSAPHRF